jgi:hypothetical protein
LAFADSSGTSILPVSCCREAAGDFFPDYLPDTAGWKPAPLTSAVPTSEFGFNDVKDSDSIKTIIGRGRFKLTDTRPAERNGVNTPAENFNFDPGNVVWTEYYGKETFIPAWITSC